MSLAFLLSGCGIGTTRVEVEHSPLASVAQKRTGTILVRQFSDFNEDDLYSNLAWLAEHQQRTETRQQLPSKHANHKQFFKLVKYSPVQAAWEAACRGESLSRLTPIRPGPDRHCVCIFHGV